MSDDDIANPCDDLSSWREITAGLGEVCVQMVRDTFTWLDRCIATEDDAGIIDWVVAVTDLQDNRPIRWILGDLLTAYERERPYRPREERGNHGHLRNHAR